MSKISKEFREVFDFVEQMTSQEQELFEKNRKETKYFDLYDNIKKLAQKAENRENEEKHEALEKYFGSKKLRYLLRDLWKKLLLALKFKLSF